MLVYFDTTTFHRCWHSAPVFRDQMSQIAEPSHVQLCPCNPNARRIAKSSLPAVVSEPNVCAVADMRALRRQEAGC